MEDAKSACDELGQAAASVKFLKYKDRHNASGGTIQFSASSKTC